jgi:hypothetical protein
VTPVEIKKLFSPMRSVISRHATRRTFALITSRPPGTGR